MKTKANVIQKDTNMEQLTINNLKNDNHLNEPDVYKIYLYKNSKPHIIYRLLDQDDTGLIYIGAAEKTTIAYRLRCFINSKNPALKQNNHTAGNKIRKRNKLNNLIEQNQLYFSIIRNEQSKSTERDLLDKYIMEYGESPPLNG